MLPYRVEFRPEAAGDLDALDADVCRRILTRIRWLAAHFEEITPESLSGRQFRGMLKYRVGDYRVLYTANRGIVSSRFTSSAIDATYTADLQPAS